MEDIKLTKEFKKCVFSCARRAMLENELFLRRFLDEYAVKNYNVEDIDKFNDFLFKIFDNDMFDVIMGIKEAEFYKDKYDYRFLKDLEVYAKSIMERHKG